MFVDIKVHSKDSTEHTKTTKNYLCSTISQGRLTNLAMLSIECEFAQKLDFTDVMTLLLKNLGASLFEGLITPGMWRGQA